MQLPLFCNEYKFTCSGEAAEVLRGLTQGARGLFKQAEVLVRLLLVVPASTCEEESAERSFSALRRLKTWLWSTMNQDRLNSVIVCHVHKDKVDKLKTKHIAQQFIADDPRKHTFGSFV